MPKNAEEEKCSVLVFVQFFAPPENEDKTEVDFLQNDCAAAAATCYVGIGIDWLEGMGVFSARHNKKTSYDLRERNSTIFLKL